MLTYYQKNQQITFKVTFVANGQLSVITQEQTAKDNFSPYFDPFSRPNQGKLLMKVTCPDLVIKSD
jgi:hypothetical protein